MEREPVDAEQILQRLLTAHNWRSITITLDRGPTDQAAPPAVHIPKPSTKNGDADKAFTMLRQAGVDQVVARRLADDEELALGYIAEVISYCDWRKIQPNRPGYIVRMLQSGEPVPWPEGMKSRSAQK